MIVSELRSAFRAFLFPPTCPLCGAAGPDERLCADCRRLVVRRAGAPDAPVPGLASLFAPFRYEGPVRTLIVRLKYGKDRHPVDALVDLLGDVGRDPGALGRPDAVVPIPLTPWRYRSRGFNQAELLAAPVATALGVPLLSRALRKRLRRPPQAALGREERLRNAVSAYDCVGGVFGRAVLVVDDVATTGATLADAARALTAAGARRVSGLVVARVD